VKRRRQIDREHRVPAFLGEVDNRRNMLDPGVVDEDVDGAELARRLADEAADLRGLRHVGREVQGAHAMRSASPARSRSIAAGSPKPLMTMSHPSAAIAVAIPSPIPLVEPVTTAVLPFNIGSSLMVRHV